MFAFVTDLRYACRLLLDRPTLTLVMVLTLALGIGANATIFALVNAIFLRSLPVEDPSRLVQVFATSAKDARTARTGFEDYQPNSYPNYRDYRDRNRVFSGLAAFQWSTFNLSGGERPEQVFGQLVTANYFEVVGVEPPVGRLLLPHETTPGKHPVVVLGHGLWQRRYGGHPALVGKTILLNGQEFTVIGVAPPGFGGIDAIFISDLWVPVAMYRQIQPEQVIDPLEHRRALMFNVIGRLRPEVALAQARGNMNAVARQLELDYPEWNSERGVALLPLAQATINPNQRQLFVQAGGLLMAMVGLVLLIACANVANLLLARAVSRRREVAVRVALGASRRRLLQQLLTETGLLVLLGAAGGLLVAFWGRDLLWALRPPLLSQAAVELELDGRVLTFTFGISLLTGLLFGLAPSLRAVHTEVVRDLKNGTDVGGGRRWSNPRHLLVTGQVALSLVALVAAGLFVRSLIEAQAIDPGFESDKLLLVSFDPGAQGYGEERGRQYYRRVLERTESLPGVRSAALGASTPLSPFGVLYRTYIEGMDPGSENNGVLIGTNTVGLGYFRTLGIPIRQGRAFGPQDRPDSRLVAVVNETMAERFWPRGQAIGGRFDFSSQDGVWEVVGVAADVKYATLGEPPRPYIYLPLEQRYATALTLHVRTAGRPSALLQTVVRKVQEVDEFIPLVDPQPADALLEAALWAPRLGAFLLGLFGFLALSLAALGLAGVLSYAVNTRTREIGIRMALGARRGDVVGSVLTEGLALVGAGGAIGLLVSLAVARTFSSLLYGISGTDLPTFAVVVAVLAMVALLAAYVPARRAARVDPIQALRHE